MDLEIGSVRELNVQLAHANSVIDTCRKSIHRLNIGDDAVSYALTRVDMAICNLEIIREHLEKDAALWAHLRAANIINDN
ncbi:hypothetical protein [Paracoccus haeundaensis]|jgi:hypothetical protein|uniref:Uncharacterized protein n=1 Tax=Paracoccus haeundaensis TaxID=225362 RepID=A0A5C4R185_9RHOB|nr:hypothetical protein [Paracoccus haeundaensis]TNH37623.1 hypothetical protein FHD67_19315 [Paracoccus haeundaensis]